MLPYKQQNHARQFSPQPKGNDIVEPSSCNLIIVMKLIPEIF